MPLQSQAFKALSTRFADGHPLETCGLHLKEDSVEAKRRPGGRGRGGFTPQRRPGLGSWVEEPEGGDRVFIEPTRARRR